MKNKEIVLECKNLSIGYGKEVIIKDINLQIKKGEFVAFTGPNGAGKTTLIRTIVGLLKPVTGKINSNFSLSNKFPLGYIPQYKVIDPIFPVSVQELIKMGLYNKIGFIRRLNKKQKEKLDQVLHEYNLYKHKSKLFSELSGGMKQKVILARAFITDADTFVVDEPTNELDEKSEQEVLKKLLYFSLELGKTVLMIGHSNIEKFIENKKGVRKISINYGKLMEGNKKNAE